MILILCFRYISGSLTVNKIRKNYENSQGANINSLIDSNITNNEQLVDTSEQQNDIIRFGVKLKHIATNKREAFSQRNLSDDNMFDGINNSSQEHINNPNKQQQSIFHGFNQETVFKDYKSDDKAVTKSVAIEEKNIKDDAIKEFVNDKNIPKNKCDANCEASNSINGHDLKKYTTNINYQSDDNRFLNSAAGNPVQYQQHISNYNVDIIINDKCEIRESSPFKPKIIDNLTIRKNQNSHMETLKADSKQATTLPSQTSNKTPGVEFNGKLAINNVAKNNESYIIQKPVQEMFRICAVFEAQQKFLRDQQNADDLAKDEKNLLNADNKENIYDKKELINVVPMSKEFFNETDHEKKFIDETDNEKSPKTEIKRFSIANNDDFSTEKPAIHNFDNSSTHLLESEDIFLNNRISYICKSNSENDSLIGDDELLVESIDNNKELHDHCISTKLEENNMLIPRRAEYNQEKSEPNIGCISFKTIKKVILGKRVLHKDKKTIKDAPKNEGL